MRDSRAVDQQIYITAVGDDLFQNLGALLSIRHVQRATVESVRR
jgi:hypothetical protein